MQSTSMEVTPTQSYLPLQLQNKTDTSKAWEPRSVTQWEKIKAIGSMPTELQKTLPTGAMDSLKQVLLSMTIHTQMVDKSSLTKDSGEDSINTKWLLLKISQLIS